MEERVMLSSAGPQVFNDEIAPGAVIQRTTIDAADAPQIPDASADGSELGGNGLQFNLIAAPGMSQQSIDGFQAAADLWSSILTDDIIVNINIDFTTLGAGILGSASSTTESMTLTSYRTNLTSDATSLSDITAVANLPAGSTFSIYTSDPNNGSPGNPIVDNNGSSNNTFLDVNTSMSKAIGVRAAGSGTVDASITFSDQFTWDFDRSNGITGGSFDFVGVAAHEIGHALGFRSGADTVDVTSGVGPSAPIDLNNFRVSTALDMFRFSADSLSNGTDIDMRADGAAKFFSIDGGTTQITTFSQGRYNGDGQQGSHWKDSLGIGIMDPTAAPGEYADITDLDVLGMDVIGWDVRMDFGDASDGIYESLLANDGPRHITFDADGVISNPSGTATVFLGTGVDTELDALQNASATGDTDDGIASIPNLQQGMKISFDVDSSAGGATLDYFVDFNQDGDFLDPGESFTTTLNSATQSVQITVPALAPLGTTIARFRISTAGGLSAIGPADDGEVEDYEVTVTGAATDDHGDDAGTATPVAVPSVTGGNIEVDGDEDYFSFVAVGGTPYKFETSTLSLNDTTLTLYDTDGTSQLAYDDDGGNGLASRIDWVAPVGGTYFLKVEGYNTLTGTYSLDVSDNDDHGDDTGTATPVAVPSTTAGNIEVVGDVDVFSFSAFIGSEYAFETSLNTLGDSALTLYDVDGVSQLDFDDDGGTGLASLITWIAPASGTYYLKVEESGNDDTGTYSLDVELIDDHGDDADTARPINVPSTTGGDLEVAGDVDYFAFDASSGAEYTFQTTLFSLVDSTLTLYDTDGVTQLAHDDDGGVGRASLINWHAPVNGTYFLKVADFGDNNSGTYSLQATLIDDHGDNSGTASILPIPSIAPGILEVAGDLDYFSFTGIAGIDYSFETHLGSLTDTILTLYDTDGVTQLAFDDDDGAGLASLIEWTAPSNGTYFLKVADFGNNDNGTYSLEASSSFRATVTGFTINGGSENRSGIGDIVWAFSDPVTIASATSFNLYNHTTSSSVSLTGAALANNGTTDVTLNLTGLASLPDGQYSLSLPADQTVPLLLSTHTITFTKLAGDLDGDGAVNFNDTVPLSVNFGATGGAAYSDGDADGDGNVNFNDTVPVSVNFGVSLAPLTFDFGDAPEAGTTFPTTLGVDGARHIITGNTLLLGASRDAEANGQPMADASGDGVDEDGVSVGPLERGTVVSFTVTSTEPGFVNGWVDFNQDGDWDDAGEQLFNDVPVIAGANKVDIAIPAGASLGSTIARFRLTSDTGYSYFGLAANGEVEDYQLTVANPAPDTAADVAEESLVSTLDMTEEAELFAMPMPAFTTFDGPLSLFSINSRSRSRR